MIMFEVETYQTTEIPPENVSWLVKINTPSHLSIGYNYRDSMQFYTGVVLLSIELHESNVWLAVIAIQDLPVILTPEE